MNECKVVLFFMCDLFLIYSYKLDIAQITISTNPCFHYQTTAAILMSL